jgi:Ras-related protein Rab-8A
MSGKEPSFKIIFIGDPGVGKTSILLRYATSAFETDYLATIGVNIVAKELSIEGRVVTLVVWDIGSQEQYSKLRKKYYANAHVVVIVYDITKNKTLENVKVWLDDIKGNVRSIVPIVLVGNKIDLPNRAVTKDEGQKLARELRATFIETSAKTGENIRNLFDKVAKSCLD